MSLKKLASPQLEEFILPEEVWILIWSHLDFKTVQKICTRVSKSWFEKIRNSKLSWEMKLKFTFDHWDAFGVKDFNAMLSHWNELRVIHFSAKADFNKFRSSLNSHKSLQKIVIPSGLSVLNDQTLWGVVTKFWIDPRHLLTPKNTVKNAIEMKVSMESIPEEFALRQNDCDLTNLETLEIYNHSVDGISHNNDDIVPKNEFLNKFKNLKKLDISLEISNHFLQDVLRLLGNTNDLKISASLEVRSDLDEEATKEIFNSALEIVQEKFPFPCTRILDLNIFENNIYGRRHEFSISYGKNGVMLTTLVANSDSESDNSDSESDTSDSMDESADSSDFMDDESLESSDSMGESAENSSSEEMNGQE